MAGSRSRPTRSTRSRPIAPLTEGLGPDWCAATYADEVVASVPLDGWLAVVRRRPRRDRRRRPSPVGLPRQSGPDQRSGRTGDPGADPHRAARRAGHPQPGDRRRGAARPGDGVRRDKAAVVARDPGRAARSADRSRPCSPDARRRPGSSTGRRPPGWAPPGARRRPRRPIGSCSVRRSRPTPRKSPRSALASFKATYDFPLSTRDDDVRRWIREELLPRTETWLAVDPDGTIVGFMSLEPRHDRPALPPARPDGARDRQPVRRAGQVAPAGRARALHVPGQQRRPSVLRAPRLPGRRPRRRGAQRGGPAGRPLPLARRSTQRTRDRGRAGGDGLRRRDPDRLVPVGDAGRRSCSSTGPPPITPPGGPSRPLLEPSHALYAIDRRGRGASGDTLPYAIAREYEDVAARRRRGRGRRRADRSTSSATRSAAGSASARRC